VENRADTGIVVTCPLGKSVTTSVAERLGPSAPNAVRYPNPGAIRHRQGYSLVCPIRKRPAAGVAKRGNEISHARHVIDEVPNLIISAYTPRRQTFKRHLRTAFSVMVLFLPCCLKRLRPLPSQAIHPGSNVSLESP